MLSSSLVPLLMIGIYGGTFDPVHYGHLRPALEVQQWLGLEEVRFIPSGQPPHRDMPQASVPQRLAMLHAAIDDQPGFVLDEREVSRAGPSYMVDTLDSFSRGPGSAPLCLILGFDAFLGLPGWHQWQRLPELAHLVITHRPGGGHGTDSMPEALRELVEARQMALHELKNHRAGGLVFVPVTQLDISATKIRRWVQEGESVRYLMPDRVIQIIQQQHIYR